MFSEFLYPILPNIKHIIQKHISEKNPRSKMETLVVLNSSITKIIIDQIKRNVNT